MRINGQLVNTERFSVRDYGYLVRVRVRVSAPAVTLAEIYSLPSSFIHSFICTVVKTSFTIKCTCRTSRLHMQR